MDNNFKLRKAIIIAIALMGTGYSLHSKAIGLSDIQVKSYLGQPLLANIKVTGLDKKMDERCFTIESGDSNAISQVNFRLNRSSDESGVLTLTSNKAVLEPIASLTVVSHCDTTFTRQYSLLIDPASLSQSTEPNTEVMGNQSTSNPMNAVNSVNADVSETTIQANVTNMKASKRAKSKVKRQIASTKLTNAQTGTSSASSSQVTYLMPEKLESAKPAVVEKVTSKPKLTISGGNLEGPDLSATSMKLSFDKRINTSRESNPQAYA